MKRQLVTSSGPRRRIESLALLDINKVEREPIVNDQNVHVRKYESANINKESCNDVHTHNPEFTLQCIIVESIGEIILREILIEIIFTFYVPFIRMKMKVLFTL